MFPYVSADGHHHDEEVGWKCPIKEKTDSRGGLKVQLYGPDCYGYLQYHQILQQQQPQVDGMTNYIALENYMSNEDWNQCLSRMDQILKRQLLYRQMIHGSLVVGILTFFILLIKKEYGTAIVIALLTVMVTTSIPQNRKAQLIKECDHWTDEQRRKRYGSSTHWIIDESTGTPPHLRQEMTTTFPLLRVEFHQETPPPSSISSASSPSTPTSGLLSMIDRAESLVGILHFIPEEETNE